MALGFVLLFLVETAIWPTEAVGFTPSFTFQNPYVGRSGCKDVCFATHHKSGSQFAAALGLILGNVEELSNFNARRFMKVDKENLTIVHFVRDPFALILSTYNWHLRAVEESFHTKRLSQSVQERLGCESNIFLNCLWEKNTTEERLVTMSKAMLYNDTGVVGLPLIDIDTILKFFWKFEELPNTMNVCIEDFRLDLVGTLERVSNLIKSSCSTLLSPVVLASLMREACEEGNCNSYESRLVEFEDNKAYKCNLYELEGSCGKFQEKEVARGGSLLSVLSYCADHASRCKYICRYMPVKAYASPPETSGDEAKKCYPNYWKTICDPDRIFVPATIEDLYRALITLDIDTFNRVQAVSYKMKCGVRSFNN